MQRLCNKKIWIAELIKEDLLFIFKVHPPCPFPTGKGE
jgi:hypothetical protein